MKHKKAAAAVAGVLLAMSSAAPAMADGEAYGAATGSPGVLSGNVIQVPLHVPIQACGNTIDIIALLNPAGGNACASD